MLRHLLLAVALASSAVSVAQPRMPPPWTPAVRPPSPPLPADLAYPHAIVAIGPHNSIDVANGEADAGRPLTIDTPVRIASNTKTFVAATLLRLWEQGRIDLDAAIGPLLTPALDALLRADGFDTARITVRQVMSHSAGFYDHGGDPRFIAMVQADPVHVFTREELVRLSMQWADPQSPPGDRISLF